MSSNPLSNNLFRAVGLVGAAAGYYLINGKFQFTAHESKIEDDQLVANDSMAYAKHTMYDYSPNAMNGVKHWLFKPTHNHIVRRPWLAMQSYAGFLRDNMIPIGLASVGLIWGFNWSVGSTIAKTARGIATSTEFAAGNSWKLAKAGWEVFASAVKRIPITRIFENGINAKHVLALGALTGLGLYSAQQLKQVVTDQDVEQRFNYLEPHH